MQKIKVKNPLVEMDGDEMTRIMWKMIKEKLLYPFLDMEVEYYDLHIKNRDVTNDAVTVDAARAVMKYGIGVKCATITANQDRVGVRAQKDVEKSERDDPFNARWNCIQKAYPARNIKPLFRPGKNRLRSEGTHTETSTIISEIQIPGAGKAELVFTPADGSPQSRMCIKEFNARGLSRESITQTIRFEVSHGPVSATRLIRRSICGSVRKTPSPKSMTPAFGISSNRNTSPIGRHFSRRTE